MLSRHAVGQPGQTDYLKVLEIRIMGFDVFISYASPDKLKADAACATLEANGIRCWIPPRDLLPGRDYSSAARQAIENAKGLLLVCSSAGELDDRLKSEVEAAIRHGIPIIPFRFAENPPGRQLGYFRDTPHWTDAVTPELEERLKRLPSQVRAVLRRDAPAEPARAAYRPRAKTYEATPVSPKPPKLRRRFALASFLLIAGLCGLLGAALAWHPWSSSNAAILSSVKPGAIPQPSSADTEPPEPPKTLQAITKSSSEIVLTWSPGGSHPILYRIERSRKPGEAYETLARESGDATEHGDDELDSNTTYYYRIAAVTSAGTSPYSAEVSAKTLPLPPASETRKTALPSAEANAVPGAPSKVQADQSTSGNELATASPTTAVATPVPTAAQAPSLAVIAEKTLFRIHGSATFCPKLVPAWAEAFLNKLQATQVERVELPPVLPERDHILVKGVLPGDTGPSAIEVVSINSTTGIERLGTGACDITVSGRKMAPEEVQFFRERNFGDMSSPDNEHVAGLDGIAIIVNRQNPIESITTEQLRRIFLGQIQDWDAVGGKPGKIKLIVCQPNAGSRDIFQNIVLQGAAFTPTALVPESGTDRDVSRAVAQDPAALSFVTLAEIGANNAIKVSDGKGPALRPSPFDIHTENYPLTRRFYIYAPSERLSGLAKEFVQFALSPDGQAIVDSQNFVGLNINPSTPKPAETKKTNVPSGYFELTQTSLPTGISIRFLSDSTTLDARAYEDVGRIKQVLQQPEFRDAQLVLVGFSDNVGYDEKNLMLSELRVKAVQDVLAREGLPLGSTLALGSAVPVASNDTPAGRDKNRRVEVWLTKK